MTDSIVIDTPKRRGKIVLQHTTGKLSGMYRIMGDQSSAPDPYPEFLPDVDMLTHHAPVSLVAVKRLYVLYREIMQPEQTKIFNPHQV